VRSALPNAPDGRELRHIVRFFDRLIILWIGLLLMIWAAGCAAIPATQENKIPTFLGAHTEGSSSGMPLVSTVPVTPPLAHSLTLAPTQTLTTTPPPPQPTRTITLPATLAPEQASDEIRFLLENPQDCASPCFWGIVPNSTTQGEAVNFFSHLRSPLRLYEGENNFSASPRFENLSINVQLETQDGLVKRIYSRIGFENYKGNDALPLRSAFSPQNLLRLYGKPSTVELSISYPTEPGFSVGSAWYNMVLRFDHYPFAVDYYRGEVKAGKYIHVCPLTDKFTVIDTLFGYDPATYRSKGIFGTPLEKVTSLDIDQFFELMTQENGVTCFDLDTEVYNTQ